MKKIILLLLVAVLFSCSKDENTVTVDNEPRFIKYVVTTDYNYLDITYLVKNDIKYYKNNSSNWEYLFETYKGDITYVSVNIDADYSANNFTFVKIDIYSNNKIIRTARVDNPSHFILTAKATVP